MLNNLEAIIKLLLNYSININKGIYRETPLNIAIKVGLYFIAKLLLKNSTKIGLSLYNTY